MDLKRVQRPSRHNTTGRGADWKSWGFLLVLALAPLPFGSVYAQAWVIWGLACGILGTLTFWSAAREDTALRTTPEVVIAAGLWVLVLAYLVAQSLPLVLGAGSAETAWPGGAELSISPLFSAMMLLRQATYLVIAASLYWLGRSEGGRRVVLIGLFVAGNAYALFGLVSLQMGDTVLGLTKWAYEGSATGPFINRNSFATYLSLSAMVSLGLAAGIVVRRARESADGDGPRGSIAALLIYLASYFLLLVTIVATQSRMGLFACLSGSVLIAGASMVLAGRLRAALYAVPLLLGALGGAVYLIGEGLLTRIEANGFSLENRLELYRQVMAMIELRPWTGWGGGTFEIAFRALQSEALSATFLWDRAHNSYLALWSELGLVFGSLPVLIVALIAVLILRKLAGATRSLPPMLIGLGAITVGAVHSLADFSLEIPSIAMLFTAILALAATAAAGWGRSRRHPTDGRG